MNTELNNARTASNASAWISGLNVLAGIWLIIAPFVLLHGRGTTRVNDIILGVVIAILAVVRAGRPGLQTAWLSWLNGLGGVWLIAGSFFLAYAGRARTNDIILGIIVLVVGLCSAAVSEQNQPIIIR